MRGQPWHHALRQAERRRLRSGLLIVGTAMVAALLAGTAAFVQSLEASHLRSAPGNTALLIATVAERDILRSTTSAAVADLVVAEVRGVLRVGGVPAASPEIHLASEVRLEGGLRPHEAFLRGITPKAYLVHDAVTLIAGALPGPGEVMVGRIAAAKSGIEPKSYAIGNDLLIEGSRSKISGHFAAPGTTLESEIWMPLNELQGRVQRDDVSVVFVRVLEKSALDDVALFAARRLDLELESIDAEVYYGELAAYFRPILVLLFAMSVLIGIAATTGGANTVIALVHERRREFAVLRAIGFGGRAILFQLLVELFVLGLLGAIIGLGVVRLVIPKLSVAMAMTAFRLEVSGSSLLIGLLGVLAILFLAALPAVIRVLRMTVAEALSTS